MGIKKISEQIKRRQNGVVPARTSISHTRGDKLRFEVVYGRHVVYVPYRAIIRNRTIKCTKSCIANGRVVDWRKKKTRFSEEKKDTPMKTTHGFSILRIEPNNPPR